MGFREGLGDSFRKEKADGKKSEKCGSRAYQKFFEDYEEVRVTGKNGRGSRIRRVYRGRYYRQAVSDAGWLARKALYPLAAAGSFLCFCMAAFPDSGANRTWYVNLFQALGVALYLWLFVVICHYVASPRNMTVSGWRRACRPVKRALALTGGAVVAAAAATALYYFLNAAMYSRDVPLHLAEYILAASLVAALGRMEGRTAYDSHEASADSR